MKQPTSAFTLIELLVVIAIISLLVSILIPSLTKAKELARSAVCETNTRGLLLTQQLYANDNGVYATFQRTGATAIMLLQSSGCIEGVCHGNSMLASVGITLNFPPYVCPNVPAAIKTSPTGETEKQNNPDPYGWNGELGVWYFGGAEPIIPYVPPDQVINPAECIGWADAMRRGAGMIFGPRKWNYYSYWRPAAPRHGEGTSMPVLEPFGPLGVDTLADYPKGSYTNAAFLDGHSEQVSLEKMYDKTMYNFLNQ